MGEPGSGTGRAVAITLFAGHYGSGKTNVALNYARRLRRGGDDVVVADLDIVNPYFRTKDSAAALADEGIGLVVSDYANSNVDFPALPKEIYALALGRYVGDIRAGGDYEMLAVLNASRPLTRTQQDAVEVLREIEAACRLPFTGLVNNTNLGPQTTPDVVLASLPYADAVSAATGLPIRFTSVAAPLAAALEGKVENLLPLDLQHLYYMMD